MNTTPDLPITRSCPDCNSKLRSNAIRCACGWTASKTDGASTPRGATHVIDTQCRWADGHTRCSYPVTSLGNGERSGYCFWHKGNHDPVYGAEIVHQSYQDSDEQYQARKADAIYGRVNPRTERPEVRRVDSPSPVWAYRFMARVNAGEQRASRDQVQMAQEAIQRDRGWSDPYHFPKQREAA